MSRISKIMHVFRNPPRIPVRPHIQNMIRRDVLNKYNHKCAGNIPQFPCSNTYKEVLEIDHILPQAIQRINKKYNLQVLCSNCHTLKTKLYDTNLINMYKTGTLQRRHVRHHLRLFV